MLNETRVLSYLDTQYPLLCLVHVQFTVSSPRWGSGLHYATLSPPKSVSAFRLDVALIVRGVLIGGVAVVASHLKVRKIHLIAEDTADASEAPDKL